jgi:hypothetical protein
MWARWSALLEALGRIRLGFRLPRSVPVGNPSAMDARGSMDWRGVQERGEPVSRLGSGARGSLGALSLRPPLRRAGPDPRGEDRTHPPRYPPSPVLREEEAGELGTADGPPGPAAMARCLHLDHRGRPGTPLR